MRKKRVKGVPWTLKEVILAILGLALLLLFFSFFLEAFLATRLSKLFLVLILMGFTYFLITLFIWYFAIRKVKGKWKDLGFLSFDLWDGLKAGFFWLIGLQISALVYVGVASHLGFKPPEGLPENIRRLFESGSVGMVAAAVIAILIAPFIEELFFRGFIYPALKKRLGVFGGIFLSALIFGLFHVEPWKIFPIFMIGAVLAYLYETSKSLGPPIILHAFNNLFSFLLLYFTEFRR